MHWYVEVFEDQVRCVRGPHAIKVYKNWMCLSDQKNVVCDLQPSLRARAVRCVVPRDSTLPLLHGRLFYLVGFLILDVFSDLLSY